jgi:hypothetical protein
VYFQPYAFRSNAGYILVDLDQAEPGVLYAMRTQGHQPCAVVETSPGHLQAWVHVSTQALLPAVATAVARQLAGLYRGDSASSDWRHVGRLAGFTNQKPQRRLPSGLAPWVKLLYAAPNLAACSDSLLQSAQRWLPLGSTRPTRTFQHALHPTPTLPVVAAAGAATLYQTWLRRLCLPQRFPQPDWSIADLWIAEQLLWSGLPVHEVKTILRQGSPGFPRRHADPEDYLHRTLARARTARATAFPARPRSTPSP